MIDTEKIKDVLVLGREGPIYKAIQEEWVRRLDHLIISGAQFDSDIDLSFLVKLAMDIGMELYNYSCEGHRIQWIVSKWKERDYRAR